MKIKDFKPNMKMLTTEIVLGPQREIFRELDYLNGQYFQQTWLYGNRSTLEPIEPLKITKKFRWGAGYKDRIIEVINTRFNQYNKITTNLTTLLRGRPERMQYDRRRFITKIINLDTQMRNLRESGFTMDANTELFENKLEIIKTQLEDSINKFSKFMSSSKNSDADVWIETVSDETIEMHRQNHAPQRKFTRDEIEVIKYQNTYLFIEFKLSKPSLIVTDGDTHLGEIPLEPVKVLFWIKMEELINVMAQKESISELRMDDFRERNLHSRRHNFNLSSSVLQFRTCSNYGLIAKYDSHLSTIEMSNVPQHISRTLIHAHPFIGRPNSSPVPLDIRTDWQSTCLGNAGTEIWVNLVKCDFIGLYLMLTQWQTYNVARTHPLNNIKMSLFGMPGHYSTTFKNAVGCDMRQCNKRLSYLNGEFSLTYRNDLVETFSNLQYLEDKEQMLNRTSSIQSYCDKIKCQFRTDCHGYQNRDKLFNWLEHGESELITGEGETIIDESQTFTSIADAIIAQTEEAINEPEIGQPIVGNAEGAVRFIPDDEYHPDDDPTGLPTDEELINMSTGEPITYEQVPEHMSDEERVAYEMELWAQAQRGGRNG